MERKLTSEVRGSGQCPSGEPPADPGQEELKVRTPAAVLAVIPYLLGFHPSASLVVIGSGRPSGRIHITSRYDLPDPPSSADAAEIAEHAAALLENVPGVTAAVVVGYGSGRLVTPVAEAVRRKLPASGIELHELLRVEGGRYWSYLCASPACCPTEGVPFDTAAEPVAAEMTFAGRQTLPDRAALARTVAPIGGLARESMRQATERAEDRAAGLVASAVRSGRDREVVAVLTEHGLRAVRDAIAACRSGDIPTSHDDIAWLALALSNIRIRDDAWARMDPRFREDHERLWTAVVRLAEPEYLPAAAALLAFTAWQEGNGALANVALARALDADPGYTMALLIRDAIAGGLPPSAAELPMTPEDVAASYEEQDRQRERSPGSSRQARARRRSAAEPAGNRRARKRPSG